jgi:flagellar protein FlgJ
MAGMGGIDTSLTTLGNERQFNNGLGAAATMGIRPDQGTDLQSFSRLLEQAQEKQRAADSAAAGSPAEPHIVPRQVHIDKTDKLYETCVDLETFLIKNLLSGMRKTVMKSDLINTGFAGEFYEDMLWDEYAKEYTKNASFGLADLAYLELTGQRGSRP